MSENGRSELTFQTVDFVVWSFILAASVGIGIYYACSGGRQQSTEEFLVGNRQMNPIPVAMSLAVSFISAVMFLGMTSESYSNGVMVWLQTIALTIASVIISVSFLPIFHRLNITSANEYLERRFNRACRLLGSTILILNMMKSYIRKTLGIQQRPASYRCRYCHYRSTIQELLRLHELEAHRQKREPNTLPTAPRYRRHHHRRHEPLPERLPTPTRSSITQPTPRRSVTPVIFEEFPAIISPLASPTKLESEPHIVEEIWEELTTIDNTTQVELTTGNKETQTDPTPSDLFTSGMAAINKKGTIVSDIRSHTAGQEIIHTVETIKLPDGTRYTRCSYTVKDTSNCEE